MRYQDGSLRAVEDAPERRRAPAPIGRDTPDVPDLKCFRTVQLRRKMSATAVAIARTEDKVAATLDRLARNKPDAARRLRAEAAEARRFAARLRHLASRYGSASPEEDSR
jgi:hypothetical protein